MARSSEKANLLMNRWTTMKENMASNKPKDERRPYLASECKVLSEAERWRRDILREVTKKIAEIMNAGLGDARLRDLNDEINKLFREKGHWERQIKALGGPDYHVIAPRVTDAEGQAVPGGGGYRYYGAAKDLPGVRELFASATQQQARRTRGELYKSITPDYYGYRDEEDGVMVQAEAKAGPTLVAEASEAWGQEREERKRARVQAGAVASASAGTAAGAMAAGVAATAAAEEGEEEEEGESDLEEQASALSSAAFRAHVPLPSQKDLEAALLAKKKKLLLMKYGGVATVPASDS